MTSNIPKNFIGNFAQMKPKGIKTGSGTLGRKAPFGHVTLSGKAGQIYRVTASEIFNTLYATRLYAQASIGAADIKVTLATTDLALSPDQDDGDHWVDWITAEPGEIFQYDGIVTCLRIEFNSDAIIYLAGA